MSNLLCRVGICLDIAIPVSDQIVKVTSERVVCAFLSPCVLKLVTARLGRSILPHVYSFRMQERVSQIRRYRLVGAALEMSRPNRPQNTALCALMPECRLGIGKMQDSCGEVQLFI
jgi:hypothetical protein